MGERLLTPIKNPDFIPSPSVRNKDLPPVEYVPILKDYERLGLDRFQDIYGMPTFVDENGLVDYAKALSYINHHVDPSYQWRLEPQEHHLLHKASLYHPRHFDGNDIDEDGEPIDPTLPNRVRDNPFDKVVIPGDLHDLWHVLFVPPERPSYMHLKGRDRKTSIAISLFWRAKIGVDIERREGNFVPIDHPRFSDKYIDTRARRVIGREVLADRYIQFTEDFREHLEGVDLQGTEEFINPDVIHCDDPAQAIVLDLSKRVNMGGQQQGIKPRLKRKKTA